MKYRFLVFIFLFCCIASNTWATTLEVAPSGKAYTSIQSAIDAADSGDVVLVYQGRYVENINFNGKAITVRSDPGAERTTIDGNFANSVVTFWSGEGNDSVLDGFTLINGAGTTIGAHNYGGGVYCENSSPTITNCTIEKNTARDGAGIYGDGSSAVISDCTISENTNDNGSTVSFKDSSSPSITGCNITLNIGDGLKCNNVSSMSVTNSSISNNGTESMYLIYIGISCYNSSLTMSHCTISENGYRGSGIGYYVDITTPASMLFLTLNNCVISDHNGSGLSCNLAKDSSPMTFNMTNCLVVKNRKGSGISFSSQGPEISAKINHCTIAYNSSKQVYYGSNTHLVLKNSILWGENALPFGNENPATVTYSDIKGGHKGKGNLHIDPLFVDSVNGDYHLQDCSFCLNTGDPDSTSPDFPDKDIDGAVRPQCNVSDMGVYEHDFCSAPHRTLPYEKEFNALYLYIKDINNVGQTVGLAKRVIFSDDDSYYDFYGFLYDGSSYTAIRYSEPSPTSSTTAMGINDAGKIVGQYTDDGSSHGFLYQDGAFTTIDYPEASSTAINAINNLDKMLGTYHDADGKVHAFTYDGSNYTALVGPPQAVEVWFKAINDDGKIVGYYRGTDVKMHSFLYHDGTYTAIKYPGAEATYAYDINNLGQIAGAYFLEGTETYGFIYDGANYASDVGASECSGIVWTSINHINDSGKLVGKVILNGNRHILEVILSPKPASKPECTDADNDGFSIEGGDKCGAVDCNDNDSTIHPTAKEVCGDGIDQDCSGSDLVCSNGTNTDADGDGYFAEVDDCDDSDAEINPATVWYQDLDGDGFGNAVVSIAGCVQPVGYVMDSTDFDDNDANIQVEQVPTLSTWGVMLLCVLVGAGFCVKERVSICCL